MNMNDLAFLNEILPLWGVCGVPEGFVLPGSPRAVIAAAFPYLLPEECYAGRNIARYAVVEDYHKICGARLERACALLRERFPGEEFAHYCDRSPLPEVALAQRAGLGVRGRHNLLITEDYGSWVVLGEIITTAELPRISNCQLSIINCQLCEAPCVIACPTGALDNGFDKAKCLSYLSQRKGALDPEIAAHLRQSNSAWGCDLCQEACPRNRGVKINPLPEFLANAAPRLDAQALPNDRAYAWRGRAVLERNIGNLDYS